ncbi:MAG: hypothetical protein Q9180_006018, partial [Flavoplaca navasiana]
PSEAFLVAGQGDETKTVGEDFVLDDGGVIMDEDKLYGKSRDFGEKDTAKRICY